MNGDQEEVSLSLRAYIMYVCASKMYKTDWRPSDALNGIIECNSKIVIVAEQMVNKNEASIVEKYILPSMHAMLQDLQEINDPEYVVAECTSMYYIGLSYENVLDHQKAFEQFRYVQDSVHNRECLFKTKRLEKFEQNLMW